MRTPTIAGSLGFIAGFKGGQSNDTINGSLRTPKDEEPGTVSEIEAKEEPVNISEKHLQELSLLMNETDDRVMEQYYIKFSEIL